MERCVKTGVCENELLLNKLCIPDYVYINFLEQCQEKESCWLS